MVAPKKARNSPRRKEIPTVTPPEFELGKLRGYKESGGGGRKGEITGGRGEETDYRKKLK